MIIIIQHLNLFIIIKKFGLLESNDYTDNDDYLLSNLRMIKNKAGFVKTETLLSPGCHLTSDQNDDGQHHIIFGECSFLFIFSQFCHNPEQSEPRGRVEMEMPKVSEHCPRVDLIPTQTLKRL